MKKQLLISFILFFLIINVNAQLGSWTAATNLLWTNASVGIGTNGPLTKLDIKAINFDSNQDNGLSLKANGGVANGIWQTRFALKSDGSAIPRTAIDFITRNYTTGLISTNVEALSIFANGDMGIGTKQPLAKLDIKAILYDANQENGLSIKADGGNANGIWQTRFFLKSDGSGIPRTAIDFLTRDYNSNIITSYVEAISIFQNGNIGIGITNPTTYKLDVNGTIRANEIKVCLPEGGCDFVFKKDYELMDLKELEKFVATNQHLPEIASEKEMMENGVNMKDLQMKLLQKVEELTLYTIGQKKEIEELKLMVKIQNERIESSLK